MPFVPLRRFKLKNVALKGPLPEFRRTEGDMPVFPEELMASVETTFFWTLENAEISTYEDLEKLLRLLFDCPEHDFYVYLQKGASKTAVLDSAMTLRGDINVVKTDLRFYRHPGGKGNFVRVLPEHADFDEMREVAQTPEYIRFTVRLSERKRRDMEVKEHMAAHAAATANPLMLQPNVGGFGIDVLKAWAWLKARLRRKHT